MLPHLKLVQSPEERMTMGAAGRACMLTRWWDDVFHTVYEAYATCLQSESESVQ